MFKDKIRYYRERKNSGVSKIAKDLTIAGATTGRQTVWSWENGNSVPDQWKFPTIQKVYGITSEEYLELLDLSAKASASKKNNRCSTQLSNNLDNCRKELTQGEV